MHTGQSNDNVIITLSVSSASDDLTRPPQRKFKIIKTKLSNFENKQNDRRIKAG